MSDDRNDDKYKMRKNGWLALAVLLFLCTLSALRYWIMDFNFFAFLIGGVFLYLGYLSLKKSGVIDSDDEKEKWTGPKKLSFEDDSSNLSSVGTLPIERVEPSVIMAVPGVDVTGSPFENKAYVMHRYDHNTDEGTTTREYFYADNMALLETVKVIAGLEFLIDRVRMGKAEIPKLQTEVNKLTPVSMVVDQSQLPVNIVCLTLKTPVTDGENAEYPFEVHFHAFDTALVNGSYGTFRYTEKGEVARADEAFSIEGDQYFVRYLPFKGEMAIDRIEHRSSSEEAPTILYEHNEITS